MPRDRSLRPPFPTGHFYAGLALFAGLSLLFIFSDLDQAVASHYFRDGVQPWPGRTQWLAALLYRYGQPTAPIVGTGGLLAFLLSFGPGRRAWRGPGLFLALLALLGPGLFANVLAKGLAGRPRPEETWGFGGLWAFHRPFQFGIPGQGRSFISGHASAAWYFLGIPFLLQGARRRWAWAGALAFGLLMGWARVSQGAHWLSDTLLAGAGLYVLAAGLSPLIHWQPSAALLRRPRFRWAVGLGAVAALSLTGVTYEGIRVLGVPAQPGPVAPQLRLIHGQTLGRISDLMADVELDAGTLRVDFDRTPGLPQPMQLDVELYGQGWPGSRAQVQAHPLQRGGAFSPGPQTLGLDVSAKLKGWFWSAGGSSNLSMAPDLPIDARLRVHSGAISIGALPAGRRVLLARVPQGTALPPGFMPYGSDSWLREGQPPLIALDLDAKQVLFQDR